MEKSESSKEEPKEAGWEFNPETDVSEQSNLDLAPIEHETVTWSASEFIGHDKSLSWFLVAGFTMLAIACGAFFITDGSWFTSLLVLIAGATFVYIAAQPPRVLEYSLSPQGLAIAEKMYDYHRFKSFSIIHEGAINSIALQPLGRFMPSMSLYYEPKDEKKIANTLGLHLPYEERELAHVDKLMKKIRF